MYVKCLCLLFFFNFMNIVYPYYYARGSCSLPKLAHGTIRMRQTSRLVKFTCFPHYSLVGERYATCRRGKWEIPFPICVKSGCPELPVVPNAIQMTSHNKAWIVFFCFPGHQLIGSPALYCDGSRWNSTVPACVDSNVAPALSCDFEGEDICGWKQDDMQDFVWTRLNKKTPSYFMFTGPSYDHTFGKGGTGYYMYIETTSRLENETARLLSPIYKADVAVNACFSFFYHMYGKDLGGLRVYQKPDKLPLANMLELPSTEIEKYLLFDRWGNQGDYWYSAVSDLSDMSDDFQIVIEGIRGTSYTSDIAIDDVAILHGDNCTTAKAVATTPYPDAATTCLGRCNTPRERGCSCETECIRDSNCCPDFVELCVFNLNNVDTDDQFSSSTIGSPPQTEKLIASITDYNTHPNLNLNTTSTSTSTSTTTSSTTSTTTTETPKTTTTITTPKVSNITTTRQKPKLITTEMVHNTTKSVSETTPSTPYTIPSTTVLAIPNIHTEELDKKRKEQNIETSKLLSSDVNTKSTGHTAMTATLILLGVALCACAMFSVQWARSSRGRATIARLRGRVSRDPEVRYLSADVDD